MSRQSSISRVMQKLGDGMARLVHGPRFSAEAAQAEVVAAIGAAGLDAAAGLRMLDAVLQAVRGKPFDFTRDSVHWLVFACLRPQLGEAPRILEIGTFDGGFTRILSALYPGASIVTVDLPESDPILRSTYRRDDDAAFRHFTATRDANIGQPNVRFMQFNSAFLLDRLQGPFDAIWVDGGHLYPEVAWDIVAARHLVRGGGWILCDDVIPEATGARTAYVSPDSHEVLKYLCERSGESLQLFLKRCSFKHAGIRARRKYVALLQRAGSTPASGS